MTTSTCNTLTARDRNRVTDGNRKRAGFLSLVAVWSFVVSPILLASPAAADTGNPEIDHGVSLYNDLEYDQSAKALAKALERRNLSKQERSIGYRHLALSCIALGRDEDAKAAFRRLLEADPKYHLPHTESAKALALFDEVRQSIPEIMAERSVELTQTASPLRPVAGTPIAISIVLVDEQQRHEQVVVYHRQRGAKSYSSVKALRVGVGRYNATIPGTFVTVAGIEYYVVALSQR
ncbi:MAG: tetratricopeptide repeat protein, partial [Pseudomonadota bacterium]